MILNAVEPPVNTRSTHVQLCIVKLQEISAILKMSEGILFKIVHENLNMNELFFQEVAAVAHTRAKATTK